MNNIDLWFWNFIFVDFHRRTVPEQLTDVKYFKWPFLFESKYKRSFEIPTTIYFDDFLFIDR